MIEVHGLTKYYGPIPAIDDVSFSAGAGEIIGFLGPNGAGKSTTMRILTAFSPATRGTAHVAGFEVHAQPIEVKRRVGYLPERVPLYEEMTVSGFLRYVAEVKGVRGRQRGVEAGRVMERCGLAHMPGRLIAHLSKGYRQRVGLAQALIGSPKVLILDEPTVGLDPEQIVGIRALIKSLGQEHTVLLSTHILPEVSMVCDRVLIINQGRIAAEDRMENLTAAGSAQRLRITADGDALAVLRAVPGVARVTEDGPGRCLVETTDANDRAPELVKALSASGCAVRRIEDHQRTLEEIFIEAVSAGRREAP